MEAFSQMIKYRRVTDISIDDIEFLNKLEQRIFPLESVIAGIKSKKTSLIQVLCDDKVYGVLVVRGVFKLNGELALVIDHAITEDGIGRHFSSILNESLASWAANESFTDNKGQVHFFKYVHQHAHNRVIRRILERYYGQASEWIFIKDIREFKNDKQSVLVRQEASV